MRATFEVTISIPNSLRKTDLLKSGKKLIMIKRINKYLIKTTTDFMIHPFKKEEFTEENPFVAEILRPELG